MLIDAYNELLHISVCHSIGNGFYLYCVYTSTFYFVLYFFLNDRIDQDSPVKYHLYIALNSAANEVGSNKF